MITIRRRGPAVRAPLQLIMVLAALLLGSGLLLDSILLVDTPPAHAQTTLTPGPCGRDGQLQSQVTQDALPRGALYLIVVPLENPQPPQPRWNADLWSMLMAIRRQLNR